MLRFFLFGSPHFENSGAAVPLRHSKALALLAYLALSDQPRDRDTLLALLWPEFDTASARNNLRRELSRSKSVLGVELLATDRRQLRWSPQTPVWIDAITFRAKLAGSAAHGHPLGAVCTACAAELASAVELYRDDFMAGFSLPDSPAFDEWQFFQREALRHEFATVLQALIAWYRRQGVNDRALPYARRWLALDGLHEPAHRALMELYARSGQHAAALRQFDQVSRLLGKELGAEPEAETVALYNDIKTRRLTGTQMPAPPPAALLAAAAPAQAERPALYNVPSPTSSFVGRRHEVRDIIRRLTDPDCHLLTLTGPGGIGKTQLALAVAQTVAAGWAGDDAIADGVLFVPLAEVSAPSGILSALADAARFVFSSTAPLEAQLLDYFRAKRMLLIFDNLEHLLDGADFVGRLIAAAPGVRVLVTSREALNLVEEWFHPLDGLSYPGDDVDIVDVGQLARFDAVQLFEQRARRLRGDFDLVLERAQVVRLCRLVEGMPLAIELAASWLNVLPLDHVVSELARGLDILTTRDRSLPERHKNLRKVIGASWRLLPVREQATLARLTVFRGGCSAEAAAAVAGATPALLGALIDASLLRSTSSGRLQLHELVRQFAAEQLTADAGLERTTYARHSAYYLEFLLARAHRLEGSDRHLAVVQIAGEAQNVRAALVWTIDHGAIEHIDRTLASCFEYFEAHGTYTEGDELFSHIVAQTDRAEADGDAARERLLARALIRRGAFRAALGAYDAAVDDLERGLVTAREHELAHETAYAQLTLGSIDRWGGGNMAAAEQRAKTALAIATAHGDGLLVARALHELAFTACNRGAYGEGKRLAQQSLRATDVKRVDLRASALNMIALAAVLGGEYQLAETTWRESLALFESIGDRSGIAASAGGVGWAVWCQGDRLPEARAYIERGIGIARELGQRLQITNFLGDLGLIAIERGDDTQAEVHAREGLTIARGLNSAIYMCYHLCVLGNVASMRHEFEAARRSLREALQCAVERQLWTNMARVVFHVALLLVHEAAAMEDEAKLARQVRALELTTAIATWPATWHDYKDRAWRLIDELRRDLPDALGAAAVARGRRSDWQAVGDAVLDDLARHAVSR